MYRGYAFFWNFFLGDLKALAVLYMLGIILAIPFGLYCYSFVLAVRKLLLLSHLKFFLIIQLSCLWEKKSIYGAANWNYSMLVCLILYLCWNGPCLLRMFIWVLFSWGAFSFLVLQGSPNGIFSLLAGVCS